MDAISDFSDSLFTYLTDQQRPLKSNLIKTTKKCDFIFPTQLCSWSHYINTNNTNELNNYSNILFYKRRDKIEINDPNNMNDQVIADIIEASKKWIFRIERIECKVNQLCEIFLNRLYTFSTMIPIIMENGNYGEIMIKNPMATVQIACSTSSILMDTCTVTEYRSHLIYRTLENLIKLSKFNLCECADSQLQIYVTHKSTDSSAPKDNKTIKIVCGTVVDAQNSKRLSEMSATDYIKKRTIDVKMISQEKYGTKINDNSHKTIIKNIGEAVVKFNLLEVKHSGAAIINSPNGSSRGAAFILYNSARLETLFQKYSDRVKQDYYRPLPTISNIDFSLLTQEEEWTLFFHYILKYPDLLEKIIQNIEMNNEIPIHNLCTFLNGLSATFSIYYRRVKILTENRDHLMPILYARLYLLQCVRKVLNHCLSILSIEPVELM